MFHNIFHICDEKSLQHFKAFWSLFSFQVGQHCKNKSFSTTFKTQRYKTFLLHSWYLYLGLILYWVSIKIKKKKILFWQEELLVCWAKLVNLNFELFFVFKSKWAQFWINIHNKKNVMWLYVICCLDIFLKHWLQSIRLKRIPHSALEVETKLLTNEHTSSKKSTVSSTNLNVALENFTFISYVPEISTLLWIRLRLKECTRKHIYKDPQTIKPLY